MRFTPMLADTFDPQQPPALPVYVQPKLDGIRCLCAATPSGVAGVSRSGRPLAVPERILAMHAGLRWLLSAGWVLDGELYAHGYGFQALQAFVCSPGSDENALLQYHLFDAFKPAQSGLPFYGRRAMLTAAMARGSNPAIQLVSTVLARTQDAVDELHRAMVEAGYEGTILRDPDAPYTYGRTPALLKRKDTQDDEYWVVGVREGEGKNAGTAVLVCAAGAFHFAVTAPGDYADKRAVWDDREAYIGRLVTVQHQGLTDRGIPRFPVARGFPCDR